MIAVDRLSPQNRVEASRNAILQYMMEGEPLAQAGRSRPAADSSDADDGPLSGPSRWQYYLGAVQVWWQRHPAQFAIALARPTLNRYADQQPLKLVGVAAAVGAAVVLFKPWRLISVTGLLLATLKSSQVSGLILTLLSRPKGKNTKATHD